jgi:RNA polymerase sigma factor (TIGR02999 family)
MPQPADATRVLTEFSRGERAAADKLLPLVYEELHELAARWMRRERRDHTLQPTALVHEAYLRLIDQSRVGWRDRVHFFAVAAEMIRRILVDHARGRATAKRGGGRRRIDLEHEAIAGGELDLDLLALDDALDVLGELNERQRKLVEMRYFSGLTIEETAEVLGISPTTAKAEWRMARAWLRRRLDG